MNMDCNQGFWLTKFESCTWKMKICWYRFHFHWESGYTSRFTRIKVKGAKGIIRQRYARLFSSSKQRRQHFEGFLWQLRSSRLNCTASQVVKCQSWPTAAKQCNALMSIRNKAIVYPPKDDMLCTVKRGKWALSQGWLKALARVRKKPARWRGASHSAWALFFSCVK